MSLGWKCLKLTALVSVLGVTIWTMGCADNSPPPAPIAPAKTNGHEAGSTKGGGTDVPAAEGDTGAAKPEADKPADAGEKKEEPKADAEKPADAEKKEEPKAEAPAEKKEEEKKE